MHPPNGQASDARKGGRKDLRNLQTAPSLSPSAEGESRQTCGCPQRRTLRSWARTADGAVGRGVSRACSWV